MELPIDGFDELSGALFKNDFKTKDNQPDYKGKIQHKATKEDLFRISGWINTSKAGKPYLSIKFSEIKAKINQVPNDPFTGGDDDIQF